MFYDNNVNYLSLLNNISITTDFFNNYRTSLLLSCSGISTSCATGTIAGLSDSDWLAVAYPEVLESIDWFPVSLLAPCSDFLGVLSARGLGLSCPASAFSWLLSSSRP